jgi:hypothetical protein
VHSPFLITVPCIAYAVVQLLLAAVLVRKGLHKTFAIFFVYNLFDAAATIVLSSLSLWAGQDSTQYFYLYWVLNTGVMLLEFGVMYEMFVHAIKPYAGLIDLAKMLFAWAALFLLLAAGLTSMSTAGSHLEKCIAAVVYLERGLRMMQCGLLLLFFLFERRLGLSWRSYSVCVALGLGVVAATRLSFTFFSAHYPDSIVGLDFANNMVYAGMVVAWVICFRMPQPERKTVLDSPAKLIFQRWNDALLATPLVAAGVAAGQMDSFLPNVEKTVDRVLARKMIN